MEVELVTGQRCQQSHSSSRRALTQIGRGQPRLVNFFSLDKGETTRHQTALPVLNSTQENRYSSTFFRLQGLCKACKIQKLKCMRRLLSVFRFFSSSDLGQERKVLRLTLTGKLPFPQQCDGSRHWPMDTDSHKQTRKGNIARLRN